MKILIIEDEVMIAELLKDYLISFGYSQIEMAHDKSAGIRMLETFRPNIVLLDIRMEKEKEGLEIGRWIYQKYQIPFMYITAHSDRQMISEIMETMPAGYINKPVKKSDLLANILRITQSGMIVPEEDSQLNSADQSLIQEVQSYLQENIYREFEGIDFLSEKYNISASKLKNNFKLVYGKPIYQYFSELQMREAMRLIKKEKLLVKEVAAKFGYESQGRFSEAFKKVNGVLPSET